MIKGKVTIDLHNHNSGFTERYEKENMITDAVAKTINAWQGGNKEASAIMPIANRILGGIMMFDGLIDEDRSNIHFPGKEAHLVGYALQDTNTSNVIRGSYNFAESGETSTGFTSVWDFGTSQANGVIRSLARTVALEGQYGLLDFRAGTSDIHNNVVNYKTPIVDFDEDTNIMTVVSHNDDASKPTLRKIYVPTGKYKVSDGVTRAKWVNESKELDLPTDNYFYRGFKYFKGGHDGYAYLSYTKKNTMGNGILKYRRIDLATGELDPSEYSITCNNCQFNGGSDSYFSTADFEFSIINNGHAYVRSADNTRIYIIDMKNPAVIISKNIINSFPSNISWHPSPLPNGGIMFPTLSGSRLDANIIYPDGIIVTDTFGDSMKYNNYNYINFLYLANGMLWGRGTNASAYSDNYLATGCLGTICNLDTGVVKSASTSMKITYTLTDAE